jgi:hypothetical protein
MEHLYVVVIFFFVLSIVFFILAHISRKQGEEGDASVNLSIGIILLIISVILFFVMVNVNHMYEEKRETPFLIKEILREAIT